MKVSWRYNNTKQLYIAAILFANELSDCVDIECVLPFEDTFRERFDGVVRQSRDFALEDDGAVV